MNIHSDIQKAKEKMLSLGLNREEADEFFGKIDPKDVVQISYDELLAALQFYADDYSWQPTREFRTESTGYYISEAELDRGRRARKVLGKAEPKVYSDHRRYG